MAITRQIAFGITADGGLSSIISFAAIPDGNQDAKAITCAHVPDTKGGGATPLQETLFFGTTDAVGLTFQTFRDDKGLDGTEVIVGMAITNRIDPSARASDDGRIQNNATSKRYRQIEFHGRNPVADGISIQWTKDVNPITEPMLEWRDFRFSDDGSILFFESGLAEWVHLKFVDESNRVGLALIEAMSVVYDETGKAKDNRET